VVDRRVPVTSTRADVARLAGTSPSVVSYVLNGGPRNVAAATRERVLAAVAELDYRPNTVARSLRMARGHALGIVVPDNANPFFADLARAVAEAAFDRGYPLLLGNAADDDRLTLRYLHAFSDRSVEGVVLIPTSTAKSLVDEVARYERPVVVVDRVLDLPGRAVVTSDGFGGAIGAVEHLIDHGHRSIACLCGPRGSATSERLRGYRAALRRSGLPAGDVVRSAFGEAAGYASFAALTASGPTAAFVTSDLQAIGVLRAAHDRGVRVPDDLAVVSIDGVAGGAFTVPGLTTMAQDVTRLGGDAVELLLQSMAGQPVAAERRVVPVRLVRRGSCGCPDTLPGRQPAPAGC